jgi:hypothetical protein
MHYRILLMMILFAGVISCSKKREDYSPERYLSKDEQRLLKEQIIRYVAKTPRRVIDATKFDTTYDEHYLKQVAQHDLLAYYFDKKSGEHFFMVARIAPSIDVKWVATGGRLRYGKDNSVTEYEEVFRTWKLPRKELEERGKYLFGLMVRGGDLTPYYTAKAGFNYIEFPDDNVYFDKSERTWKSRLYGSVEEMVYENREKDSLIKK